MTADDSARQLNPGAMVRVGRYDVPEDWPASGEAGRTFRRKLENGFFATYLAGEVIVDLGYRGYERKPFPILPHAIGVDLDYPGYDGNRLPFQDASVDTVYSSHTLEHIADYQAAIRDWHRVLKPGGFIVCIVPHQFLYEKKTGLPSFWNPDHKRFYTPASLLCEFEQALEPNSYRIRHLCDWDEYYDYEIGPEIHPNGCYEIELALQKIETPGWHLAGGSGRSPASFVHDELSRVSTELSLVIAERNRLASERVHWREVASASAAELSRVRTELSSVLGERDHFASESARWFDAAVVAAAEPILQMRQRRRRPSLRRWIGIGPAEWGRRARREAALDRAVLAADSRQWERAARFCLDALLEAPHASPIWNELKHALRQTGRYAEAEIADRLAAEIAEPPSPDQGRRERRIWAAAAARRAAADPKLHR